MLDWKTTAFIFPGQGSQVVGMAQDIAATYPVARQTLEEADSIMGIALSKLMAEGPEEQLGETSMTQPAMYVGSIALLRALQTALPEAQAAMVAGHSLGELTALTAAGALAYADGVRLVQARGRLMAASTEFSPGAMAAILSMDVPSVRQVCAEATQRSGLTVVLANDNCPGQIVISGHSDAVDLAIALAKNAGAKRAIKLAVSTAPHSPLMESIENDFTQVVNSIAFQAPRVPVYANISAQPLADVEAIRAELEGQLTQPVHWTDTIRNMIAAGAQTFIEVGSKDVLTGLLKRIDPQVRGLRVSDVATLQQVVALASA